MRSRNNGSEGAGKLGARKQRRVFRMKRREFLKVAGAVSAATIARGAMAQSGRGFVIVIDSNDPVASAPPVQWAAEQLRAALAAKGAWCHVVTSQERVRGAAFFVLVNATGLAAAK